MNGRTLNELPRAAHSRPYLHDSRRSRARASRALVLILFGVCGLVWASCNSGGGRKGDVDGDGSLDASDGTPADATETSTDSTADDADIAMDTFIGDSASDTDTTIQDTAPDIPTDFNPDDPGFSIMFMLGAMNMMGQDMGLAVGAVTYAAREQFGGDGPGIPVDTCVIGSERQPECNSNADCAPEQSCEPETDSNGSPIANSERCVTPTEPMDVGPFTVSGFSGGSKTFAYNSGQSGAYTEGGQGDGQVDPQSIAFNTTYHIEGSGDPGQGLGAFSGDLQAPARFTLTAPSIGADGMGLPVIDIDPTQDLVLRWSSSGDPSNTLTITVSGMQGSVTCRAADDGEFTIDAATLGQLGLSPMLSMLNAVTFEYGIYGTITGEGVSVSDCMFQQMLMVFAQIPQ